MASRSPSRRLAQTRRDQEVPLPRPSSRGRQGGAPGPRGQGQGQLLGRPGWRAEARQPARGHLGAVGADHPGELQVLEGQEGVAVQDRHAAGIEVNCIKGHWLHDLLGLMQLGARLPVGLHQPIDTEVHIRRRVLATKVSAKRPKISSVLRGRNALVNPIPNEPTLQNAIFVNDFPIFLECSQGVSHCMCILTHDQWKCTGGTLIQLTIPCKLGMARVHRAEDVGVHVDCLDGVGIPGRLEASMLILHRSRWIPALQPHVCPVMVDTISRLVPQRPDDNTGKILVALDVALHPSHVAGTPHLRIAQGLVPSKVHAVALDVCLVNDVEAKLVTELVPERVVGVVGAADSVEVVLFHEPDVGQHRLAVQNVAPAGVVLVPVRAPERKLAAVQQEPALADLHRPEAHPQPQSLRLGGPRGPPRGLQGHEELVERGLLGAPGPRGRQGRGGARREAPPARAAGRGEAQRGAVAQELAAELQLLALGAPPGGADLGVQLEAAVGGGPDLQVPEVAPGPGPEVHAAGDAREPPHVLVLEVRARAPALHAQGEDVPAAAEVRREQELRRELAVRAEAQLMAVQPGVASAADGTYVQEYLQPHLHP
mmetsp:Transcript_12109/g.34285  ORF Transcript_12109/g.34285 Transcript_12109/m.34285 type:complete len:598 (-) Transcript_12109:449-2242(-)